jgi:hypothetical protein
MVSNLNSIFRSPRLKTGAAISHKDEFLLRDRAAVRFAKVAKKIKPLNLFR